MSNQIKAFLYFIEMARIAMNNAQKETIDLLIDYINAEDWGSIQVILRGQFLDVFDPINEAKQ